MCKEICIIKINPMSLGKERIFNKEEMKMFVVFSTFVVTLFMINVNGQTSPCPTVFEYQQDGNTKYGIITIPGPGEGVTVVNVKIVIYGQVSNNNLGKLKLRKSLDSTVEDAKRGLNVQYTLNFPQSEQWPIISKIDLNYQTICNGTAALNTSIWKYEHNLTYPSGSQKLSIYAQTPSPPPAQVIIKGKYVKIGEYPWMVALFEFQRRKFVFFCGANLITDRYVITAAHCVKSKTQILLKFGAYHLEKTIGNSKIIRASKDIIVHSEYKDNQAHADIATILFRPITFTKMIHPIRIWPFHTKFDQFIVKGLVSGWGQADALVPGFNLIPLQAIMHRVSLDECRESHIQLKNLASNHTFCAGGKDTGPCRGDSGSGFFVNISNTWYLRGIISTSLGTQLSCSVDKYSVFVDLVYYLDWIKDVIRSCRHYGKILKIDISVKISKY